MDAAKLNAMWVKLKYVRRVLAPANPGHPPVPQQDIDSARELVQQLMNEIHQEVKRQGE